MFYLLSTLYGSYPLLKYLLSHRKRNASIPTNLSLLHCTICYTVDYDDSGIEKPATIRYTRTCMPFCSMGFDSAQKLEDRYETHVSVNFH